MMNCRTVLLLVLVGAAPLHLGCNRGSRLDRLPVHGTVTVAGGEQLNGSITFIPAKGGGGPSVTAKLEEGKYQFDRSNGPIAGAYNVVIRRVVSREASLQATAARRPIRKNGQQWTPTANVADDGQYLQDFALK